MTRLHVAPNNLLLRQWCDDLRSTGRTPRVVFAEGDDPRVRTAAAELVHLGIEPILICVEPRLSSRDSGEIATGVATVSTAQLLEGPAGRLVSDVARRRRWSGDGQSRVTHPVYLAAACVHAGLADACVAGSTGPTGDVLRAGIQIIGLAPDSKVLSSSFLLLTPGGAAMSFGDCAVVPDPDEHQLAEIAIATAATFQTLAGTRPVVAMLSFSTLGSAEHETVVRVRNATQHVRAMAPDLLVDGEMQFDTAMVASVAAQKAAGSAVAGHANVFIFPNLSAGNIGYKIAQRLGGAEAFGPIIQGLNAPMNDLSRGCSVSDIIHVAVISAIQAMTPVRGNASFTT